MTIEEAQLLRRQKDNIQMMVFNCVKMKQDAKSLVLEYHQIVDKLVSNGYKVFIRSPYLRLDYWGITPNDINVTDQAKKIENPNDNNYYILNLAWTGEESIIGVDKYLNHIGLQYLEVEDFGEEHIAKYKYIGEDNGFNVIKKSTQYILDSFVSNQNINVYGKKLNYKI